MAKSGPAGRPRRLRGSVSHPHCSPAARCATGAPDWKSGGGGGTARRDAGAPAGRGTGPAEWWDETERVRPSLQQRAAAPRSRRGGRANQSRSRRSSGAALLLKSRRRGPGMLRPLCLLCIGYCQRQLAASVNKPGAISAARSSFAQWPLPGGGVRTVPGGGAVAAVCPRGRAARPVCECAKGAEWGRATQSRAHCGRRAGTERSRRGR